MPMTGAVIKSLLTILDVGKAKSKIPASGWLPSLETVQGSSHVHETKPDWDYYRFPLWWSQRSESKRTVLGLTSFGTRTYCSPFHFLTIDTLQLPLV